MEYCSTNGLQSRSRKWLLAFTTSMFALSTIHWASSVVLAFRHLDFLNNCIRACYNNGSPICLLRELLDVPGRVPPAALLALLDDILLINVSTLQYRALASCPRIFCKHPRELTHHLECWFSILLPTVSLSGVLGSCVLTNVGLS